MFTRVLVVPRVLVVAGLYVTVCVLVAVGTLGAQDFGSQSRSELFKVRVRVLMEVVLLLEVVVIVEVLALLVQIRPDESSNIASLSAVEVSHAPQSVCANDDAP